MATHRSTLCSGNCQCIASLVSARHHLPHPSNYLRAWIRNSNTNLVHEQENAGPWELKWQEHMICILWEKAFPAFDAAKGYTMLLYLALHCVQVPGWANSFEQCPPWMSVTTETVAEGTNPERTHS